MVIGMPVLERPDLARMTRPPPRERVISYGVGGLWCDTICSLSVGREAASRGSPPLLPSRYYFPSTKLVSRSSGWICTNVGFGNPAAAMVSSNNW